MKKIMILILIVFFVALGLIGSDKKADEKLMMEKWQKYATPNANHKALEYFAGKWNTESDSWMKPGDKPIHSTGVFVSKMIMGGRYLKGTTKGIMMGMPFEGFSLIGFDNLNKKYVGIWIDTTGTGIFPFEGTLDKSGKVRTDLANWDDLMTGGKMKVKMVTTILSKEKYKFEMFTKMGNSEFKSMEMIYTRVKK